MEVIIMVGQLLLGLSILVGLHEWGHMVAAKSFGMRVEKFSIGFPPKIWSRQIGETEYSFGAVPLGGFVKITGMIDESLDTKKLKEEPEPYEFRAKPAWQRLIVMLGGIIVNVITGVIIFILIAFADGESYLPKSELNKHGIVAYDLGQQLGFQTGDRVVNVNGQDFERFSDILSPSILMGSNNFFTVSRNGEEVRVDMPNDFVEKLSGRDVPQVIAPRRPFTIGALSEDGGAKAAGIKPGDQLTKINGYEINYFDQLASALDTLRSQTIATEVLRDGETLEIPVNVNEEGKLGFYPETELNLITRSYTVGEAMAVGSTRAFSVVWLNIQGINKMVKGEVSARKSMAGPIRIATMFGGTWDWDRFWYLVGLLSMVLAFMNLLPIPALDGGHVMFLSWEIITGRKPSDQFLEGAQKVGMVVLLSLMAFVIINDILMV